MSLFIPRSPLCMCFEPKWKLPIGDALIQIITMDATYVYPLFLLIPSLMTEDYCGYIWWQQDNNKKEKKRKQGDKNPNTIQLN